MKEVYKIFIAHQSSVQEVINKNNKEENGGPITVVSMAQYTNNKIAVLFISTVDEKPRKVIKGTLSTKIFYGAPKKVQIDLNLHKIKDIISFVSTGKYLNVLCLCEETSEE